MFHLQAPLTADIPVFYLVLGIMAFAFLFAEILVRRSLVSSFVVRKLMHFGTGVLVFFIPVYFTSNFYPVMLGVIFFVFSLLGVFGGLVRTLHDRGMQPDDGGEVEQLQSYGPLMVPLVFILLSLVLWDDARWLIQTSMLVMGVSDSLAALVGSSLGGRHIENLTKSRKSVEGSLAMFLSSFVLLVLCFLAFRPEFQGDLALVGTVQLVLLALLVALIVTAAEALLSYGWDNFFIPFSIAYVLYVLSSNQDIYVQGFLVGGLFALFLSIFSIKVKFLDNSGATATFLLGTTIFGIGGIQWTVPLLTFYLLSSVLSKLGRKRKARFDLVFEKGSQRDAGQVYANGGIAWIIMIIYSVTQDPAFFFAYLGTLAAVQSDTWATEIGTMWPNPKARLITTMQEVPVGTSGGVSIPGTLGAFGGALLICASAIVMQVGWVFEYGVVASFLLIGFSGLLASLVDSFFGATVQAQYYDPIREKVTERTHSMAADGILVENRLIKGHHLVNNDLVNTLCALSGSALAYYFAQGFN